MATASDTPCLSEIGGILTNPNRNVSLISGSRPCNRSTIRTSPYTPQATAAFAIAITSMMILTIVGNILVIIAVLTSRSLKGPQNLFLVSLAAADILVATLIIPFSLANELQGYWAFSIIWCEIYLALDVLFCTSSIVHLCAIALDRYLSISKPVSYGAKRTPSRIKAAIIVVWLISAVISFPPLLTLDKSEGGGEVCELNNERWYILYSTIGSFFAPCVIMILVYVRIYQIAKQHTRNPPGQKKPDVAGEEENPGKAVVEIPAKISEPSQHNGDQGITSTSHPEKITTRIHTSDSTPSSFQSVPAKYQNATDNPLNSGKISVVRKSISSPSISIPHREIHQIPSTVPNAKKPTEVFQNNTSSSSSDSDQEKDVAAPEVLQDDIEKNRQRKLDDRTSGLKGHVLSLAAKYKNTLATSSGTKLSSEESPKLQGTPMSRRKAMVNREKRFTFVLAVVMGGFVICWFPFFFSYSLMAVCPDACSIPNPLFKFFFWIGYCNSCLNPVIYTIFNHDFRKAFKRILCRDIKGTFF